MIAIIVYRAVNEEALGDAQLPGRFQQVPLLYPWLCFESQVRPGRRVMVTAPLYFEAVPSNRQEFPKSSNGTSAQGQRRQHQQLRASAKEELTDSRMSNLDKVFARMTFAGRSFMIE